MTTEELKARLAEVKHLLFIEEMADFMNWSLYYKYTDEIRKLQRELDTRGE